MSRPSAVREFFTGVGYLGRGLGHWRYAPGAMFLGWIPAFAVFAIFLTVIVLLGINLETLTNAITPFADRWDEPWRTLTRVGIGIAVLLGVLFLGIRLFTAVTLILGAWFYERIWASVERRFGAVPDAGLGFWRGAATGLGDALRLLVPSILFGLVVIALNLIPLLGAALSFVFGAIAGGWLLTIDLTGFALGSRRLSLRERRAAIRGSRAATLGFGVATYLVFLIPGGTILAMPAAVAGASLLARRVIGEPVEPARTAS